jgi:hypothetical protein
LQRLKRLLLCGLPGTSVADQVKIVSKGHDHGVALHLLNLGAGTTICAIQGRRA